jgi:nucleoside-diphosphate-sugar epimerase
LDKKILVTGADGFVGRALIRHLRAAGHVVVPVVRSSPIPGAVAVGDIAKFTGWRDLLAGIDAVVHLAARAHVLHETAVDPAAEFRRVNVTATTRLAEAAAAVGVERFVFLSSIGVNGRAIEATVFREDDVPNPGEPYAASKWEAERELMGLAARTHLKITRLRPPLVVGSGAKGNLRRLLRLVDTGIPLPLGAFRNPRSFVGLDDLCELLKLCITHEAAAGQLFLAAHRQELSTRELLAAMAEGLGRRIWMPAVPVGLVRAASALLGQGEPLAKLTSTLRVSSERAQRLLGWECRIDIAEEVKNMARAYRLEHPVRSITNAT